MKASNILTFIVFLLGEALIFFGWHTWGSEMPENLWWLNSCVCALAFALPFLDSLFPWINLKDKSNRRVGQLGLRALGLTLYIIGAILAVVLCNVIWTLSFELQLMIQVILFFFYLVLLIWTASVGERTAAVYREEQHKTQQLNDIKQIGQQLLVVLPSAQELPAAQAARIQRLAENLRYVSPSESPEAHALENEFTSVARRLIQAIQNPALHTTIEEELSRAENLYQQRKTIY